MFLYSRRAQEVFDLVSKTLLSDCICGCDLSVPSYSCRAQILFSATRRNAFLGCVVLLNVFGMNVRFRARRAYVQLP